jgi:hypothetical protein
MQVAGMARENGAQRQPADAAEAVDSNSDWQD